MGCSLKKFSSNTVKTECYSIYDKNIRIIKMEFQRAIAEMNKSKSIEPKKMLAFLDRFYSKDVIIKYINDNLQKDKRMLMGGLRILLADMESLCLKNLKTWIIY